MTTSPGWLTDGSCHLFLARYLDGVNLTSFLANSNFQGGISLWGTQATGTVAESFCVCFWNYQGSPAGPGQAPAPFTIAVGQSYNITASLRYYDGTVAWASTCVTGGEWYQTSRVTPTSCPSQSPKFTIAVKSESSHTPIQDASVSVVVANDPSQSQSATTDQAGMVSFGFKVPAQGILVQISVTSGGTAAQWIVRLTPDNQTSSYTVHFPG